MRKVIVILAAFLLAGCADVDKGLYSLASKVSTQDRVTGRRSLNLASRAQQIQNSNSQTSRLLQQEYIDKGRPLNEQVDARAYARLQSAFRRVHAVSHLRDEEWRAWLLPDAEWNAFTAGGTEIFVFKGLMDDLNDDELAAVIGHEIAHVAANHVYESQANAIAGLLRGSERVRQKSYQAAFTLKNEEEADTIGILYAALAGYDPYAAARLWQRMYENQGDYSAAVIDHPVHSRRAASAAALAGKYAPHRIAGRVNPDAPRILQQELGGPGLASDLKPGEGAGFIAALETAAGTYFQHQGAKAEQKAQAENRGFIAAVNDGLRIRDVRIMNGGIVQARVSYDGPSAVRNLNLIAAAGKETATYTHSRVLPPGAEFVATFNFRSDLRRTDPATVRFGVAHAERP